jgi:nitrite reductase (NO-forming)
VSGDYLYWPTGGPLLPTTDTSDPPPEPKTQVIALKIGGRVQVEASPAAEATPEEGAAAPAEQATPEGNAVSIEMVDLAFQPNTFTIMADTATAITFTNNGQLPHNFTCDPLNVKTKDLNAGESETISIMAAAGEYDFYCSIPGHKDAGMVGVLTVE